MRARDAPGFVRVRATERAPETHRRFPRSPFAFNPSLWHTMAKETIEEVVVVVPTEKAYADVLLTCRDCGQHFTWTAGEQEFYQGQGLKNPPARCGPCRIARKEAQEANPRRPSAFGGNRPGGNSGYRPGLAGNGAPRGTNPTADAPGNHREDRARYSGNGGGYVSRPQRVLFDTICAECGQATQVPFQPRGDRPVYCRSCFDRRRAG